MLHGIYDARDEFSSWPCSLSLSGLVRISARAYPGLSYWAEKGFWLMMMVRIGRTGFSPTAPRRDFNFQAVQLLDLGISR